LITIGALTSNDDGSTSVISDTLNNLDWLRWDELADLTYAETLFQTSLVGHYLDWTIAGEKKLICFSTHYLIADTIAPRTQRNFFFVEIAAALQEHNTLRYFLIL
jgi:hypothetical protein